MSARRFRNKVVRLSVVGRKMSRPDDPTLVNGQGLVNDVVRNWRGTQAQEFNLVLGIEKVNDIIKDKLISNTEESLYVSEIIRPQMNDER